MLEVSKRLLAGVEAQAFKLLLQLVILRSVLRWQVVLVRMDSFEAPEVPRRRAKGEGQSEGAPLDLR